uniref:Uncharacterized protein LOC108040058 n=1 Tax=Drosophila rhopaloa TaxID=1041015 RepID=A0A6P4E4C2_DRORH
SPSEVCQLTELLVLRLTQLKELDIKATLKALSRVIQEKGSQLKSFQLNCNFMDHAKYLSQMKLNLCLSLDELELVDCIFKNQDLTKLCLPVSQSYTLFCNCPDLNDDQLLDFIKASPNLKELVLIECPKLTEGLLNNVVKVRCSGETQPPLLFRIKDSQDIWESYQKNLSSLWTRKRSILKLECITEEYVPIDNVQFIFHEPLRSPIVL